jgi:hypothetical protein
MLPPPFWKALPWVVRQWRQAVPVPYLGIELQVSLASSTSINGELSRPVHDAASGLQARPKGLHLWRAREEGCVGHRRRTSAPCAVPVSMQELGPYLVREAVWWGWLDVGNEG